MARRIEEDHKHFIDIIDGRYRQALKKHFRASKFVKRNGNTITIPSIDIPHIVYGDHNEGLGRGSGKKGDVFRKDGEKGQGNGAGQDEGEGIVIHVDMEDMYDIFQEELELPDLQPKPNQTYEDIRIKYNNIALTGPESLRHNRRTMLQALKRMSASGELGKLSYIPGFKDPVQLITPINSDKRYRQYKEIHVPSSNAVVMFGRDGSGSMDEYKCEIVSDMCWWIDGWIRRFYDKVERCFFWHDTVAQEVDEDKFYNYRYGGGTMCSSCPKLMAKQLENRFPPDKWNIYCLYFTDGDNWNESDNNDFAETVKKSFPSGICNLFAVTQIMAYTYDTSLKRSLDAQLKDFSNYRSISIDDMGTHGASMSEDDRNEQVKEAIKHILSNKKA